MAPVLFAAVRLGDAVDDDDDDVMACSSFGFREGETCTRTDTADNTISQGPARFGYAGIKAGAFACHSAGNTSALNFEQHSHGAAAHNVNVLSATPCFATPRASLGWAFRG